jgi:hypothetical protein
VESGVVLSAKREGGLLEAAARVRDGAVAITLPGGGVPTEGTVATGDAVTMASG